MNCYQSCMFDDSIYLTEEEYLDLLREAMSAFDEPDEIPEYEEQNIEDVIVWAN